MRTILVIEDEANVRDLICDLLVAEGFAAISATNGTEGVSLAQNYLPDLILCDVQMPEMDGYQVLQTLHETPSTATIPFIFLTARGTKLDQRRGMELGADDYLVKPFTTQELLKAIATRLDQRAVLESHVRQELEHLRGSITLSLPHEFRTPITGILTGVELLRDYARTGNPGMILEVADDIEYSTRRLYRLVQNFLLYAELELLAKQPAQEQKPEGLAISGPAEILHRVIHHFASRSHRKPDLQINLPEAALAFPSVRLQKVIEELLDNAFKFSEAGTPIQIAGTVEGDRFQLCITNQGRGLTPEQLASLGAYVQFDRKIYEQQGGGLGLAIVQRILHLYGGNLVIQSVPQQETRVIVDLPLATPEASFQP